MKIETQNINVAACRFYAQMGARLGKVHLYAYRAEGLDEVELTWYKGSVIRTSACGQNRIVMAFYRE